MPAIAGHNSRVRIWPHKQGFNQGNDGSTGVDDYIDMFATRWQLTYRTEAIDATTFEAPRVPFVTPMMTYTAGITDIEFTIDALWDTDKISGNPYGFPDLRPGTRPVIDLYIKKGPNDETAATMPLDATPGMSGSGDPIAQVFRMVAVISDCTTDSEVRGLVKYTISGSADPYILEAGELENESFEGEYWSTGIWLPSFLNNYDRGPAFSSQNQYWTEASPGQHAQPNVTGNPSIKPNLVPNLFSGTGPNSVFQSGRTPTKEKKPEEKKKPERTDKVEKPDNPTPPPASL